MLIPGISQVGARSPFAGRSAADAQARRPRKAASAQAPAEPAEVNARDDGDADEISASAPQQGMTLAAAQAAYASN